MATLRQIKQALSDQVEDELGDLIPELQVISHINANPTPPSIDVVEANPFQAPSTFGGSSMAMNFDVRARVTMADVDGGIYLLETMLDPDSPTSVQAALESDGTLGGTVSDLAVTAVSGLAIYPAISEVNEGSLVGCTWSVEVLP